MLLAGETMENLAGAERTVILNLRVLCCVRGVYECVEHAVSRLG